MISNVRRSRTAADDICRVIFTGELGGQGLDLRAMEAPGSATPTGEIRIDPGQLPSLEDDHDAEQSGGER